MLALVLAIKAQVVMIEENSLELCPKASDEQIGADCARAIAIAIPQNNERVIP